MWQEFAFSLIGSWLIHATIANLEQCFSFPLGSGSKKNVDQDPQSKMLSDLDPVHEHPEFCF